MQFRDFLDKKGVKMLDGTVDPLLEAARVSREDQTIPWIAVAKGKEQFRIAGNIFSTRDSLSDFLNVEPVGFPGLMMNASSGPVPPTKVDLPSYYRTSDVESLPIPRYYTGDGGPYITSGIFHAGFQGCYNLSFHRMMHMGGNRFAVRVVPRHLKKLLVDADEAGRELGAIVSVGADPASLLAASTTAAYGSDELDVASRIHEITRGDPLKVTEPYKDGLKAPLGTEIMMCGVFTGEKAPEGPFVDITSTYDRKGMKGEPVFQVDKVLVREDPIMHVLLPGGLEHFQMMGIPKEPSIMSSVSKVVPEVHGVRLTEGGCCWLHGVVSITKQKEGDGKNAAMAALSGHPSMKRVIVVDGDVDIFDDRQVEWALATRYQSQRDLIRIEKARGSTLDPSSDPQDGTTSKECLDATMPLDSREEFRRVDE